MAAWLNSVGITGIILKYRVLGAPGMSVASLPRVRCSTPSEPSAWFAAEPRNGELTRSVSG